MKISELEISDIKFFAKEDLWDAETVKLLNLILSASIAFIKSYTGLTLAEMDTHEDLTIALEVLCCEMYENRQYAVQNDKVNALTMSILGRHCVNFL